jgi:hypothetical protein
LKNKQPYRSSPDFATFTKLFKFSKRVAQAGTLILFTCLLLPSGCGKKVDFNSTKRTDNGSDASNRQQMDSLHLYFSDHWKSLISTQKELGKPVVVSPALADWQPVVSSDCVFSPEAGAKVPRVVISWVEKSISKQETQFRVDISSLYQAFEQNRYSSVYPVKGQQRFMLPPNSALIEDTAAVLKAGIALFPKLESWRISDLPDTAAGEMVQQHHLILEDLAQGRSYTIRICRYTNETWSVINQYVFNTQTCVQRF